VQGQAVTSWCDHSQVLEYLRAWEIGVACTHRAPPTLPQTCIHHTHISHTHISYLAHILYPVPSSRTNPFYGALDLNIYIYIYIYIYTYVHIYIYTYISIHTHNGIQENTASMLVKHTHTIYLYATCSNLIQQNVITCVCHCTCMVHVFKMHLRSFSRLCSSLLFLALLLVAMHTCCCDNIIL